MSKSQHALSYARRLLNELAIDIPVESVGDHPALAWRRAGLQQVTGPAEGPGLVCPAALASAADGALLALKALVPDPDVLPASGALLLGERARLMGLERGGRISANRSCRLLATEDGHVALNLARPEDWDLMPVLLGGDIMPDWSSVEDAARRHRVDDLVTLGIELGLPIARSGRMNADGPLLEPAPRWGTPSATPLVIDLSPLWAGPLAASLLGMAGAVVIKVESTTRLDGARRGHAGFYDLLNGGKRSVTLDFNDPAGRAALAALIGRADIVIEGSRPRALRRLGIDRDATVARGGVWVAITAHQDADRVGFGDDAAVAGGLADTMAQGWGQPMFAGDAIADPMTGLHAALAAWAAWRGGGGRLIALSLAGTIAYAMAAGRASPVELREWQVLAGIDAAPLYPLRRAAVAARPPGTDNAEVLPPCC